MRVFVSAGEGCDGSMPSNPCTRTSASGVPQAGVMGHLQKSWRDCN